MAHHRLHFSQQDRYPLFHLGNASPGSPDSIAMPGLGRLVDGMQGFRQYASHLPQVQGTGDAMSASQGFPSGHGQQAFAQNQALQQFIIDQAGPWTPLNAAKRQPAGASFNHDFSNFGEFRGPPPSEADTASQSVVGILSDSGYGSMAAKQSVGNPSVYGDAEQNLETQSLVSLMQAMGQDNLSKEEPRRREARGQKSTPAKRIICPVCKISLKTNSELKKHQARHDKPFKCDVAGCTRATEGFSTNNDLDRHKKCVHKLTTGDGTFYRCDMDQCKGKDKIWPRPDNFKQHLKRKHGLENADVGRFIFRPASLVPAEAGTTRETTTTSSNPVLQQSWAGLDHSHISGAGFRNGDSRFAQTSNVMPHHGQSHTEERGIASLGATTFQYRAQNSQESARLHLDMEPVLSGLSVPRPPPHGTDAPVAEQFSGLDQPTCIAPNVLSHARTEVKSFGPLDIQVQPRESAQLELDDTPEESQEDAQSEVEEIESTTPDEMDVDDAAQDDASEDGQHNTNSEDVEPSGDTADNQSNLLRNAGAQYLKADGVHIKPSPSQVRLGADTSQPIELDDETHASAVIQSLIKKGKLGDILKKCGYSAPEEPKKKDQKPPAATSSAASGSSSVNKCPACPKTFPRPCELKKHQKRHAKPYACTFPKCDKKFGSKNDWKRHENSQHFQLEIWRCVEKPAGRPDQPECGKVYHRRESLKSHLEKDHRVEDHAVLDKKLAECRMGRNFESRFWCGFCQKTIEPTGKGGPANSERFDHIDNHFNGRDMPKADIKDWKHVDTDPVDVPDNSPEKGKRYTSMRQGDVILLNRQEKGRKRARGVAEDGGAHRAKRAKDSNGKVLFWVCCECGIYWRKVTTLNCMNGCNHALCDNCEKFEGSGPSSPSPTPAPAQAEDGVMA